MTRKKRIFVSHSSKDNEAARGIVTALKAHGCDVWYDENDLEFGQFRQNIEASLLTCQVFMVLLSENACESQWVQREIDAALGLETADTGLLIVPVLLSSCTVPPLLAGYKRLDFTSSRDYATELDRFVRMLNEQQGSVIARDVSAPTSSQEPDKAAMAQRAVGTLLCTYDVHASSVTAVAWEPKGNRIASGGDDGVARIWDADTAQTLLTYREHAWPFEGLNIPPSVFTIAWSPNGLHLVSAGKGSEVRVWNATTGQTISVYKGHTGLIVRCVYTAVWSPDGRHIASVCSVIGMDKTIHVWEATTGKTICKYDARFDFLTPVFFGQAMAWSPDGTRIAFGCGDKALRIWSIGTSRHISTLKFSKPIYAMAWSSDGRRLALAIGDNTAQLWDTMTGKNILIYRGHTGGISDVAWSPDETCIATASDDATVQIWDSTTGSHIYTYRGHSKWIASVAWSPDGTRIASASDKTVQIWQAR